ncbi:uncharacterized protein V6R79_025159 [Siganus canaliculatus]
MAEVDFGDRELFQQLDDSGPLVAKHIRFTEEGDNEEKEEMVQLQTSLEECNEYIHRLTEENILTASPVDVALANNCEHTEPSYCSQNRNPTA